MRMRDRILAAAALSLIMVGCDRGSPSNPASATR
jgi:hypothetical protein